MFSQDGALYRLGGWILNVFVLNTLWVLFSLPLITIGPATVATFHIAQQWVLGREPKVITEFWRSFRKNFVQATVIWLIIVAIGGMLFVNVRALRYSGQHGSLLYLLQIVAVVELLLLTIYCYSLIARFHITVVDCLRTAFLMTHRHLNTSVSILALFSVLLWLVYYWPILVFLEMGLFAVIVSLLQVNVFNKY